MPLIYKLEHACFQPFRLLHTLSPIIYPSYLSLHQ